MPDTDSITIIKRFTYRGSQEEWSNTYHLEGTTPTNAAGWKTLADAIITSEKSCVRSAVSFVRAYGYQAGNEHSVATVDYVALGGALVTGTLTQGSGAPMAGDQAAMLRCTTTKRSSKGKPVYVRKYFHGGWVDASNTDNITPQMKAALEAHGAVMIGGTLPGSMKWCAPQGEDASIPAASPYVTTRTLKRRGKRP